MKPYSLDPQKLRAIHGALRIDSGIAVESIGRAASDWRDARSLKSTPNDAPVSSATVREAPPLQSI
jgi:hypothetical protein